jgi:uncharacterized membrane protein
MMWNWGDMGMGGWQVLAWVVLLGLVAGAIAIAVVALARSSRSSERGASGALGTRANPPASPAETELEMRYARGEIDAEQLARGRAALRQ